MKPVRVSQVNSYIGRILQTDPLLGNLSVQGELSNLKYHGSGHVYFSLKDEKSRLNCFLPQEYVTLLRYELEEGMEITASGSISVFQRGGSYSLTVKQIDVSGAGDLATAFEKLKEKLGAEGLFDAAHKQAIPSHPERIVLITSETGAVVHDMIKIIRDRNEQVEILLYPCLVQGEKAALDIAEAVDHVNLLFPETDLILLGRGGGSTEELWAFNEEVVARSIYRSRIPIISAVGHETDVTIADFVADRRAATPTDAARMAVPETKQFKQRLMELRDLLSVHMNNEIRERDLMMRRFTPQTLMENLLAWIDAKQMTCDRHASILESENPVAIMGKGYGAILDEAGHLATGVDAFEAGDSLTVLFNDGNINCCVNEVRRHKNEGKGHQQTEF